MSTPERQAADYRLGIPYALATVTSAERVALPSGLGPGDGHVWWSAEGEDVFVRFGDDEVTVAADGVSTVTDGAITDAGDDVAHLHLVAGAAPIMPKLPAGATHFAHISAATGGFLRFGEATGRGGTAT